MKRVLIFVSIPTHFREMIRVARLLHASARYVPIVLFASPYGAWEKDAATCRNAGIAAHALHMDETRLAWADLAVQSVDEAVREQESKPRSEPLGPARNADILALPRRRFADRIPGFVRPHLRHIWRRIFKAYWDFRASIGVRERLNRLQLLWRCSLFPVRLLLSPSRSTPEPTTAACANGVQGNPDYRTPLGEKMVAAFGEIWTDAPERLPAVLGMKRRLYRALPELLRMHRIELLVVPEDNYFLHTHFFIDAAHSIGASAVIVPFTIANSLEWVEGFFSSLECQVRWPPNILMARAFPEWVYEHKGRKLIMPALEVLMNEYLGLTPLRPWLMNSGFADALAVEGSYMADYYRRAGIDSDRIAITGSLADDELRACLSRADEHRAALYEKLNLPGGKPMLLVSVPPNQLRGDGRPQCEFRTYESIVRALLDVACGCEGWNIVLSLHPRVYRDGVKFIQEFPCKIAEDDIASLVPLCDLFVASASATIRLAAAAGKPVVNYDVFRYRYSDYHGVLGVLAVEDYQAYRDQLRTLARDPVRLGKLAEEQRRFAAAHALADGRSGERMLALFDRLIAKRANPKAM